MKYFSSKNLDLIYLDFKMFLDSNWLSHFLFFFIFKLFFSKMWQDNRASDDDIYNGNLGLNSVYCP